MSQEILFQYDYILKITINITHNIYVFIYMVVIINLEWAWNFTMVHYSRMVKCLKLYNFNIKHNSLNGIGSNFILWGCGFKSHYSHFFDFFNKMAVSVHMKGHVACCGNGIPKGPMRGWHLAGSSITEGSGLRYTIDIDYL